MTWALVLLSPATGVASQNPARVYATATREYVAGDFLAAAELLRSLQQGDIQQQATHAADQATAESGASATRRAEQAAMLHTEYALFGRGDGRTVIFHIDMARVLLSADRRILQRLRRSGAAALTPAEIVESHRAEEFLRHWFSLGSSVLLLNGADIQARSLIGEATRLLPDDPQVSFWEAVVLEFQSTWGSLTPVDPRPEMRHAMPDADQGAFDPSLAGRTWRPVEAAFRRVLALDAGMVEARLHLGYALLQQRRLSEAIPELQAARDGIKDRGGLYLSHLFLARAKEIEGDLAGAALEYEVALALGPSYQTAYIALSELEERRGHAQRARSLVARFAAIPPRDVNDPWWAYHTTRVPLDDLESLRRSVRE